MPPPAGFETAIPAKERPQTHAMIGVMLLLTFKKVGIDPDYFSCYKKNKKN
jgi:hypothetical protein